MRTAEAVEVLAFALIVVGVFGLVGVFWASIAAGVFLALLAAYAGARS